MRIGARVEPLCGANEQDAGVEQTADEAEVGIARERANDVEPILEGWGFRDFDGGIIGFHLGRLSTS